MMRSGSIGHGNACREMPQGGFRGGDHLSASALSLDTEQDLLFQDSWMQMMGFVGQARMSIGRIRDLQDLQTDRRKSHVEQVEDPDIARERNLRHIVDSLGSLQPGLRGVLQQLLPEAGRSAKSVSPPPLLGNRTSSPRPVTNEYEPGPGYIEERSVHSEPDLSVNMRKLLQNVAEPPGLMNHSISQEETLPRQAARWPPQQDSHIGGTDRFKPRLDPNMYASATFDDICMQAEEQLLVDQSPSNLPARIPRNANAYASATFDDICTQAEEQLLVDQSLSNLPARIPRNANAYASATFDDICTQQEERLLGDQSLSNMPARIPAAFPEELPGNQFLEKLQSMALGGNTFSSSISSLDTAEDGLVDGAWPSVGSARHQSKECKPCLFWYNGACLKGQRCHFCHIPHNMEEIRRVRPSKATRNLLRQQRDKEQI